MILGGFKRTTLWTIGIVAMLAAVEARAQFWGQSEGPPPLPTQQTPPPAGTSRGENFSAKPPSQLFASDCTGAGCHRGPQGLSKDRSQGGLASFLREHYTNSRESAAVLAAFLVSIPAAARPQPERPPRAAARTGDKPDDAATPPAGPRRTPAAATPPAEPAEGARPETPRQSPAAAARAQRGRQTTVAPAVAEPPPTPPAPPPPKEFDIFD